MKRTYAQDGVTFSVLVEGIGDLSTLRVEITEIDGKKVDPAIYGGVVFERSKDV